MPCSTLARRIYLRDRKFPAHAILGRLIAYRPVDYAIMIGQTIIFYLVELVPGLAMKSIFDTLPGLTFVPPAVWAILGVFLATALLRWLTIPLWFWAQSRLNVNVGTLLRRNMLAHILAQPGARALPSSAGEAISRFRDDVTDSLFFLGLLPDLPTQVLTLATMVFVLARVNPILTLVAMIPILISVSAAQLSGRLIEYNKKLMQESIGMVTGSLGEIFGAVQAINLGSAESNVATAFEKLGERRRKAFLRVTLLLQFLQSLSYNSSAFATAAVLLAAVVGDQLSSLSAGDLVLFITYFGAMNFLVGFFGELLNRYRQTIINLKRMTELMIGAEPASVARHFPIYLNKTSPDTDTPGFPTTLQQMEVSNLGWVFPGTEAGIRNCSFTVNSGQLTVITGRIGTGKTTLLRALLGLLPATGEVRWNGQVVQKRDKFFQPPHSAYVPQVPKLFSDTLRENILVGAPDALLKYATYAAVLDRDITGLDKGLETEVGVRGTKVSGGQLQRTAAARAFVRQVELVVVDDVSSALDLETETELWKRVFEQTERRTILAVSHRAPALERAAHIVVMKDGTILDQGTLSNLLQRCAEMREIYQP